MWGLSNMWNYEVIRTETTCTLHTYMNDVFHLEVHDKSLFVRDHEGNEYYMNHEDVELFIAVLRSLHCEASDYMYTNETDNIKFRIERIDQYVPQYQLIDVVYLKIQPKHVDKEVTNLILRTKEGCEVQHQLLQVRLWLESILPYLYEEQPEEYEIVKKHNGKECVAFTLKQGNHRLDVSQVKEGYQVIIDGNFMDLSEEAYENLKDLLQEIKK